MKPCISLRTQGEYSASRAAAWKAFSLPALGDNLASKTKALSAALIHETKYKIGKRRSKERPDHER